MEFTVPQFIERETRIVGPLTFKQFVYIGIAGSISLVLYFTVSFGVFLVLTILLVGGSLALAFFKFQRTALPILIKNFFIFLFKSRVFLWQKKETALPFVKKSEPIKKPREELTEEPLLKIPNVSNLSKLGKRIEMKTK